MENTLKYPNFRWVVFITMILATVAQSVVMIAPSPLIGEISHTLGIDPGMATACFMAIFNFALGIGSIAGGVLLDKLGIAKTYIIGFIMMIVGSLLIPAFGTNLTALVVLRIIQGFGAGPITGSVARVAAEWFPVSERAFISGIQGMSISLGVAVGFIFAPGIFASTQSWHAALAWTAVFCVLGLILTLVVLFGPQAPKVHTGGAERKVNVKPYLAATMTWTCVISATLLCWIFSAFNDLTPGYIAIPSPVGLGQGAVAAGQVMTIYQIAYMAGSLVSGVLVQKVFGGKERPVILMSFVLAAIFTFSIRLPLVYETNLLIVCLCITGFFMSMANPALFAFISKKYPEEITGKIGGLAMGVGIFGSSFGVLIGSVALSKTGNYLMSITIVSIVALVGLVNALFINEKRPVAAAGSQASGAK